jgi:hypothetical protein
MHRDGWTRKDRVGSRWPPGHGAHGRGQIHSSLMHEGYLERIEGPFKGYYVAAYAGPAGPRGGYVSYAKVCRSRPVSYWEANCLLKDGIGITGGSRLAPRWTHDPSAALGPCCARFALA